MSNLEILLKKYESFTQDPNYVYKLCLDRWLVIMQKLSDTKTNESRKDVKDKKYAKFRADKLLVIEIVDALNPGINHKEIDNKYSLWITKYTVNTLVFPDFFEQSLPSVDKDIEKVCAGGIHYFLTLETAFYYRDSCPETYTGPWFGYYDSGSPRLVVNYINGKKTGMVIEYYENDEKSVECRYNNDLASGIWVEYYENGHMSRFGLYKDDKKIGLWTTYYENGQTRSEGEYINGLKTGPWTEYHGNGKEIVKGEYFDDLKTGSWTKWYSDSKEMEKGEYIDGLKTGLWTMYYENGKKKEQGTYVNDMVSGPWTYWAMDGWKTIDGQCENGKGTGLWTFYHENGIKSKEVQFIDDMMVPGSWTHWDTEGQRVDKNGRLIGNKRKR